MSLAPHPTRVLIGIDDHGADADWTPLRDGHLLIAGAHGSGKSVKVTQVVDGIPDAEVHIIDLAGGISTGSAASISHDLRAGLSTLESLDTRLRSRLDGGHSEQPAPVVVAIDGLDVLSERARDVGAARQVAHQVGMLLRLGRHAGIHVVATTQQLTAGALADMGASVDLFASRLLIGRATPLERAIVFGEGNVPLVFAERRGIGVYATPAHDARVIRWR